MSLPMTPSERRRRRRRRLLVWATLPVWLTVLVLGLHLGISSIVAAVATGQYGRGEIGAANVGFTFLKTTNVVEKWKAPYDLGTSLTRGGEPLLAIFYLQDAQELAPKDDMAIQCKILINSAVALEMMGDEELAEARTYKEWAAEAQSYVDAGEPYPPFSPWGDATPEELREEAKSYAAWAERDYEAAQESRAACEDESESPEQQEENDQAQERLEDKEQEADAEGQDEQPQGGASSEEEAEAQRQKDLAERNAEAEAEAEAERQEQEGSGGGSETKNW